MLPVNIISRQVDNNIATDRIVRMFLYVGKCWFVLSVTQKRRQNNKMITVFECLKGRMIVFPLCTMFKMRRAWTRLLSFVSIYFI